MIELFMHIIAFLLVTKNCNVDIICSQVRLMSGEAGSGAGQGGGSGGSLRLVKQKFFHQLWQFQA